MPSPSLRSKARVLLRERFGHPDFQKGQWEPIDAVLDGQDALVVMPTGSGKSIVYQLPALMLPGLTVVVSPHITVTGFARPNLRFEVKRTVTPALKDAALTEQLRESPGAGVVYVATVREAERLYEEFAPQFPVGLYHGKMAAADRKAMQDSFM